MPLVEEWIDNIISISYHYPCDTQQTPLILEHVSKLRSIEKSKEKYSGQIELPERNEMHLMRIM